MIKPRDRLRAHRPSTGCFEDIASIELVLRLKSFEEVNDLLRDLPHKVITISSSSCKPRELPEQHDANHVRQAVARMQAAIFTAGADKSAVVGKYEGYIWRIGRILAKGALAFAAEEAPSSKISTMPEILGIEPAQALQLAEGQLLCLLPDRVGRRTGGEGVVKVSRVHGAGHASPLISDGDGTELSFDDCSQAVLPFTPAGAHSSVPPPLLRDLAVLRDLKSRFEGLPHTGDAQATLAGARMAAACADSLGSRALQVELGALRQHILRFEEAERAMKQLGRTTPELRAEAQRAWDLALEPLATAVQPSQPDAMAAIALRETGTAGHRQYCAGQRLSVRQQSGRKVQWIDVEVVEAGPKHRLRGKGADFTLELHPWNHALRTLAATDFEALQAWWGESLRTRHAYILDAISAQRLDIFEQTLPIRVTSEAASAANVNDPSSLCDWLRTLHKQRCRGDAMASPTCMLLTAGPATGKTALMSQLVMLMVQGDSSLVPILVKVQLLQRRLLASPNVFERSWNWIDAFLRLEHEDAVYLMLRQVRCSLVTRTTTRGHAQPPRTPSPAPMAGDGCTAHAHSARRSRRGRPGARGDPTPRG